MKSHSVQVNKNCNGSLHCDNTDHVSTTMQILTEIQNKTMQWKKEIRTTLEESRKQKLQNKFPTPKVIPFLPKPGNLASKFLIMAMNAVVYTRRS